MEVVADALAPSGTESPDVARSLASPYAEQARADERDGYLVREAVFSPDEVAAMIEASEDLVAGLVEGRQGRRFTVGSYTFEADLLEDVMLKWEGDTRRPARHRAVRPPEPGPRALGPRPALHRADAGTSSATRNPILFTEKLNLKRPFHGGPNPLHQDRPYWDEAPTPEHTATAIVYLDDTTTDNGCLEVVPGSHTPAVTPPARTPTRSATSRWTPRPTPTWSACRWWCRRARWCSSAPTWPTPPARTRTDQDRRALLYSYHPAGLTRTRSRPSSACSAGRART